MAFDRHLGFAVAWAYVMTDRGIGTMNGARILIGGWQADYARALAVEKRAVQPRLRYLEIWGGIIGLLVISSSMAAVRQTRKSMKASQATFDRRDFDAWHDPLTSLPKRRMLLEETDAHLHECDVASMIFLELDGFKAIHDHLGHDGGDRMLKMIAERLSQVCRTSDLVCGLGGDVHNFPPGCDYRGGDVSA